MAYVLFSALRRFALPSTPFVQATCGTILRKLPKTGGSVGLNVRRCLKVTLDRPASDGDALFDNQRRLRDGKCVSVDGVRRIRQFKGLRTLEIAEPAGRDRSSSALFLDYVMHKRVPGHGCIARWRWRDATLLLRGRFAWTSSCDC